MATEGQISIAPVCRQLGYSKQAYYKSLHVQKDKSCKQNIARQKVLSIRAQMPRLGTRKLHYLLKAGFRQEQIPMGRDKLFDLLREEGLLIVKKKKYTRTTNSKHWMRKYPDIAKPVDVNRPEQLWVADITYVTVEQGHCYLHLITDAYSKRIMGYHASESLAASCTFKALGMAVKNRQYADSIIHHSDRGLQYCSGLYTNFLTESNIQISMTETGSPYDNAIAERVNGILKDEFGLGERFVNLKDVHKQLKQVVQIYNEQRPHLSNHMLTPIEMHQQNILKPRSWHKKTRRISNRSSGFLPSLQI